MARKDARVLGMLGAGGMARSHVAALRCVRDIRKLQVFSPTRAHREAFGREMAEKYAMEVTVCDRPEDVYRGADIVASLTNSAVPVLDGSCLEPGTHIINIGGGGKPDAQSLARVDAYLRFGNAPAPTSRPDLALDDEYLRWTARPDGAAAPRKKRGHGVTLPDKVIYLADIVEGRTPGRTSDEQITWSERGNLQGAQFFAVAGKVYELARAAGLGREIPTEWFLQDIRD
jgi:ornithine cyclodeaminase/alanine dehydrogenase-like protein (mu-crystallin family)